jgi:hypothetical protein
MERLPLDRRTRPAPDGPATTPQAARCSATTTRAAAAEGIRGTPPICHAAAVRAHCARRWEMGCSTVSRLTEPARRSGAPLVPVMRPPGAGIISGRADKGFEGSGLLGFMDATSNAGAADPWPWTCVDPIAATESRNSVCGRHSLGGGPFEWKECGIIGYL